MLQNWTYVHMHVHKNLEINDINFVVTYVATQLVILLQYIIQFLYSLQI